ncbi:MAG: PAS domain S-box protein [Pseudomonadota bacterium]
MDATENLLSEASRTRHYKTHVQGAVVRSATSSAMWLFALFAYWMDDIQAEHLIGISCSVLFLVLMNLPTLFVLKRIADKKTYANFSLFINLTEVIGYTGVIYSAGGFEATFLTPIYAGLITYLGAMAPRRVPYIVASFSALCYGSMVILVDLGILPRLMVDHQFNPSLSAQIIRSAVVIALLFIVAYISSFTAGRVKHARDRLRRQNKELEEKTTQLENSRRELAMDIARRKKAEEKLQKSEEKYRFLTENMADIVWTLDRQYKATYMSPSIEKVLGFTPDRMMHRRLQEIMVPESWQRVVEMAGRTFRRDIAPDVDPDRSVSIEVEYYTKDGDALWMEDTVKAIRDADGAIVGVYGVSHDISARKEAERHRLELERHALKAQKAESLGRMAGAIAHLFNNKLSVVQGNLELTLAISPDEELIRGNLIDALEASRQAAEVSGLMLSYLGLGSGKCEPLDLSRVFRKDLPLLRNTLPDGIVLETDVMADGPVVYANATEFWQILSQLLTNAREAIGKDTGRVTLTVRTIAAGRIPKADLSPNGWEPSAAHFACIEVSDTGCGIAEADMDKVFDPFFTTKFTGRGLGLAVTLGVVKAWGGAIGLESKQGRGSVARIYLPIVSYDSPRRPEEEKAESLTAVKGGTVLLVDDQENVRTMAEKMLKFLGYEVIVAGSGFEAIKLLKQNREVVRCVITDLTMPDMDGWQTLAILREIQPDLPVILSSGYDESEVMMTKGAEQLHAFLHKPYSLKDLKEKLLQVQI